MLRVADSCGRGMKYHIKGKIVLQAYRLLETNNGAQGSNIGCHKQASRQAGKQAVLQCCCTARSYLQAGQWCAGRRGMCFACK